MAECFLKGVVCVLAVAAGGMTHPMAKGSLLLVVSLCVGVCVGKLVSVWLGLVLVVVYAGGVLVLFCYVCCLAPSCLFLPMSWWWFFGLVVGWVVFLDELLGVGWWQILPKKESWSVCLSVNHYGLIPFLGCVLCLVLMEVCKMSQIDKGPLRLFRSQKKRPEKGLLFF
uniref:NADH dehydrogenase subunit 6 n=1 Tax=Anadara antiquata TaxID=142560 RepID=A0A516IDI6_9BIVA|nr:NADH dehydrogenase subunit 6 [Anadara antiquata]